MPFIPPNTTLDFRFFVFPHRSRESIICHPSWPSRNFSSPTISSQAPFNHKECRLSRSVKGRAQVVCFRVCCRPSSANFWRVRWLWWQLIAYIIIWQLRETHSTKEGHRMAQDYVSIKSARPCFGFFDARGKENGAFVVHFIGRGALNQTTALSTVCTYAQKVKPHRSCLL